MANDLGFKGRSLPGASTVERHLGKRAMGDCKLFSAALQWRVDWDGVHWPEGCRRDNNNPKAQTADEKPPNMILRKCLIEITSWLVE